MAHEDAEGTEGTKGGWASTPWGGRWSAARGRKLTTRPLGGVQRGKQRGDRGLTLRHWAGAARGWWRPRGTERAVEDSQARPAPRRRAV